MKVQRRAALIGILSLALLGGCSTLEKNATLHAVLIRHAEARGGAAALNTIENMLNVATVAEPAFGEIKGRYIASTAQKMRVDVFYGDDRVFSEGIDEEGEWQWRGDARAATPSTKAAIDSGALRHGIIFNLYGLEALSGLGHHIQLDGRQTINGLSYYKLKITLDDGFETWRFINPETSLIDYSRDYRPFHPDIDPTPVWIETRYEDFRTVDGVVAPWRWTTKNLATGEVMQTGIIHRLEYNVLTDELNFSRAASVIAP